VPAGFREGVELAVARRWRGDLGMYAAEAEGFEWESEGLRLVGRAQLNAKDWSGARATWESIRRFDPTDREASTVLGTLSEEGDSPAAEPPRVLLFTGHMVDASDRAEKGKPARFPADREEAARQAIERAVEEEYGRPGGVALGIAGGASGGDILFHETCGKLGIPTRLYLALPKEQFIAESVAPARGGWVARFDRLSEKLPLRVLAESKQLPPWLAEKPHYDIWQRNNLWMLHNALAEGGPNVTLIALWDGAPGDGPGGTGDLVARAKQRQARTILLDTKSLFGL
jgi:hypothetical protein